MHERPSGLQINVCHKKCGFCKLTAFIYYTTHLIHRNCNKVQYFPSKSPERHRPRKPAYSQSDSQIRSLPGSPVCSPAGSSPSLYITTIEDEYGQRRHHVKGLRINLPAERGIRYDEWDWELVMIVADNEYAVQDWTHSVVGHWLKDLIDSYQENIILIMKSVKNGLYIKVILEVLREDGSIGEKVREAYEIFVRMIEKFAVSPDITHVQFQSQDTIRVRHGAMCRHYLRAQDDNVRMDNCSNPPAHEFTCYTFSGLDETDGLPGQTIFLCVLQEPQTNYFLVPRGKSPKLRAIQGTELDIKIEHITQADPRFFRMIQAGSGQGTYFLKPLVFKDYYLEFNVHRGLTLQRCEPPPYDRCETARNFTFEFIPVGRAM
ncbi:hypothetical protein BaRGS_00009493 [Batillaria attramentaria]|uniref:Uncharacterized protein n=1 Tax=Batillaria attramentaria TaxID=370345 RepID=A0ABD0LJF0_9CAEN